MGIDGKAVRWHFPLLHRFLWEGFQDFSSSGDGSSDPIYSWFQFDENTYVVADHSEQSAYQPDKDTVIKLSGLLDLSQSYFMDHGLVIV